MRFSAITVKQGLMQIKQMVSNLPNRKSPAPIQVSAPKLVSAHGQSVAPPRRTPPQRSLPPIPQALPSLQSDFSGGGGNSSFYTENGGPAPASKNTDAQINNALHTQANAPENDATSSLPDDGGLLDIKKDFNLYAEYEAWEEKAWLSMNDDGETSSLKAVGGKEYIIERDAPGHKSGHLMYQLRHYFETNYIKKGMPQTFTEFLVKVSEADMAKIWNPGSPEATREYIRRFKQGVRYLSPEKSLKYNVVNHGGKLRWEKWGMSDALDTTIQRFYERKHQGQGEFQKDCIAIWVLGKNDQLYTHAAKLHRFHHSSFTSGDLIRCGGDWEVKDGKIEWISGASGHYRPTFEHLRTGVEVLANKYGVNANQYKVKLFKRPNSTTVETHFVPARDLLFQFQAIKNTFNMA